MRLSDVLGTKSDEVVSLPLTATVGEAAEAMKRQVVGALVIREPWGRYLGMLSERNLVLAIAQHGRDLFRRRAGELMWANAPTGAPNTTIQEALRLMRQKRVRHLPVLDHGNVLGVVSLGDLLDFGATASGQNAGPRDLCDTHLAA
jgi:CBS domain-containing protein